jgi:hypothetical protein
MSWYKARLDRRWPCGNYKIMDYYLRATTTGIAATHVRRVHPRWRLLSIQLSTAPEIPS